MSSLLTNEDAALSSMGFETYVIRVLQHYLRAQKKRLTTEDSSCLFDAILPDGMDDIKGPLYLEVKSGYASKTGYFRSVQQFALHARGSEPGAVLLVLGIAFTEESRRSMEQMAQSRAGRRVCVWDIDDFSRRT